MKNQEAILEKTGVSIIRAEELSRIAEQLQLPILAEFWKEAARMLTIGLQKQNEALKTSKNFLKVSL